LVGTPQKKDNERSIEKVNELLAECDSRLSDLLKRKPFQGVSDPEKHQLEALYELAETNSVSLIRKSLLELSTNIKVRGEESRRHIDEQKDSLSLAKKGLFATVGFSIISIGLAIYFYINPS
jgi:hypothetical protein